MSAFSAAGAQAATLHGRVASGDAGIAHTGVTLLRTSGGGHAPVALGHAHTNAAGAFTIAYRKPSARTSVLYLTTSDGLAAVLGTGSAPSRAVLNERTTVAAGYGLAQFVARGRVAGRSPGLQNAALMAANLARPAHGDVSPVLLHAPNGRKTSTLRAFGSLSNLVAYCARGKAACARIERLATPPGGRRPHGALQLVADLARNPAHNVAKLFRLTLGGPHPYRLALAASAKPDAWTLALRFVGDGTSISGPGNFAIDAKGDVWVAINYQYSRNPREQVCASDEVAEFTPDGRYAPGSPFSGGGLSGVGFGITFDPDGNLWLGNFGFAAAGCEHQPPHDSVSKFAPSGRPLSQPAGCTQGDVSWPMGTVSDRAGNIWIANCGNDTITRYPDGDPAHAQSIANAGVTKPFDIAFNGADQAFVTGNGNDSVAILNPNGTLAGPPITGHGLERPMGIAVDSRGNMWVANSGLIDPPCPGPAQPSFATRGGSLTLIGATGTPKREQPFTGGGLTIPWGITVDGDDNVWIANFGKQRLSEFCGMRRSHCPPGVKTGQAISPAGSGYGFDGLVRNTGVAVDPSGNVWLTNNWKRVPPKANPGGYQIVAFVGAAAPLRTPVIGPPRGG